MPLNPGQPSVVADASQRRYWHRVRWLTAVLMVVWAGVSFAVVFEARLLSFSFFGWPFSFWWTGQGALLIFLALVGLYARAMSYLDAAFGTQTHD